MFPARPEVRLVKSSPTRRRRREETPPPTARLSHRTGCRRRSRPGHACGPGPQGFAGIAGTESPQMPEIPKSSTGRVGDPMGDERPLAFALAGLHGPGGPVVRRIGIHLTVWIHERHRGRIGVVRQPPIGRIDVGRRGVPTAVVAGRPVSEVAAAVTRYGVASTGCVIRINFSNCVGWVMRATLR